MWKSNQAETLDKPARGANSFCNKGGTGVNGDEPWQRLAPALRDTSYVHCPFKTLLYGPALAPAAIRIIASTPAVRASDFSGLMVRPPVDTGVYRIHEELPTVLTGATILCYEEWYHSFC